MTPISKNVCINRLKNKVHEYNNTYHRAIKMKLIEVNTGTYFEFYVQNNDKDPRSKNGDRVRIKNNNI